MPTPLRSLPRVFIPGASAEAPIALPAAEVDKFRKVLRMEQGDELAVLPNDGSLIRCAFRGREAEPLAVEWPNTEPARKLTLVQALPKGDRLDTIVRMGTEIGVSTFVVFHAVRSVARWEPAKRADKMRRLEAVIREAAEQSYRCILPQVIWIDDLAGVLAAHPKAVVLSEVEGLPRTIRDVSLGDSPVLVIGPEGGWDPKEIALIGERGVTLGPLVLRTDTAGVVGAALALLDS